MIYDFKDKTPDIDDSCFIAPSVDVIGDVSIGKDSSIWFGSVLRGDMHYIEIGSRSNIQDNCTVHVTTGLHPTIIGSEVTVGHNVIIHGCEIEDRCLIGMGAIIMDGAVIGSGSLIGAGALVSPGTVIPPNSLVVGLPGKVIRETTEEEKAEIIERAQHYIDFSKKYM
jgi:carbonic anhydrase/acetyltransferase-like protein (isoleucine patch superfamily)